MLKRVITGAAIVVVTVGFFLLRLINPLFFDLLILIIAVVGEFEMIRAFNNKISLAHKVADGAFTLSILTLAVFSREYILACLGVYALIFLSICVFDHAHSSLESLAYAFLCAVYPVLLVIPFIFINALGDVSTVALALVFASSALSDTFAFFVGSIIKGKKLCPSISPKKTISGAIGGLIGGIVAGIAVYALLQNTFLYTLDFSPYLFFSAVGLITAFLTEIGDLVESAIKRSAGIKDMGNILPGHGGVLDRVDGLIFSCAFVYLAATLL